MTSSKDPLLQPYRLKHLTLKNRIMSTSHEPAYSEDGMPKDRYRLYHLEKAKGGMALTMTAGSAIVSEDSPPAFGNLHAYSDEIVPWLKKIADDCHEHGAAVMIQMTHMGARGRWSTAEWLPLIAPSSIPEPVHRSYPKAMEDWDFTRVMKAYADAAEKVQAAGMDGIELECASHLIAHHWSPATNRREDEYGGSIENRMRLVNEILAGIRKDKVVDEGEHVAGDARRIQRLPDRLGGPAQGLVGRGLRRAHWRGLRGRLRSPSDSPTPRLASPPRSSLRGRKR